MDIIRWRFLWSGIALFLPRRPGPRDSSRAFGFYTGRCLFFSRLRSRPASSDLCELGEFTTTGWKPALPSAFVRVFVSRNF